MIQRKFFLSLGIIAVLAISGVFLFLFSENTKPTSPSTALVPTEKNKTEQTTDDFVGTYISDTFPSTTSPSRVVTLTLSANGENPVASLSINSLDDASPVIREGLWETDGSQIVLTLPAHGETFIADEGEEIYFNYEEDTLTMTDYDPTVWGSEGLILHRQKDTASTVSASNSLLETSWEWFGTEMSDGSSYTPKPGLFTLVFVNNTRFIASTDCNRLSGDYKVFGNSSDQVTFSNIISTKMSCAEDSLEQQFVQTISNASIFSKNDTELFFHLKNDSGIMTFKAIQPEPIQPKIGSPLENETSDATSAPL